MIRNRDYCLDGLNQLWRCNDSGNPFTFNLVDETEISDDAEQARLELEAALKRLPLPPERVIQASAAAKGNLRTNREGRLSRPQSMAQDCYQKGIDTLLALPWRKSGFTRAQIEARPYRPGE
jgi:hypothetical protein